MNKREARSRDVLACLGDASRFRLVLSLLERERCVTELAFDVGLSQSCTTRHLQYLEREGLVRGVRHGKRVVFGLRTDRPRVRELLVWVTASTPPAAPPGELSGAEIHHDHRARHGAVGERRPRARRPVRRPAGPGSDGPHSGSQPLDGPSSAGRPSHDGLPYSDRAPAPDLQSEPQNQAGEPPGENPGTADDGLSPPRAKEMEDWLL